MVQTYPIEITLVSKLPHFGKKIIVTWIHGFVTVQWKRLLSWTQCTWREQSWSYCSWSPWRRWFSIEKENDLNNNLSLIDMHKLSLFLVSVATNNLRYFCEKRFAMAGYRRMLRKIQIQVQYFAAINGFTASSFASMIWQGISHTGFCLLLHILND